MRAAHKTRDKVRLRSESAAVATGISQQLASWALLRGSYRSKRVGAGLPLLARCKHHRINTLQFSATLKNFWNFLEVNPRQLLIVVEIETRSVSMNKSEGSPSVSQLSPFSTPAPAPTAPSPILVSSSSPPTAVTVPPIPVPEARGMAPTNRAVRRRDQEAIQAKEYRMHRPDKPKAKGGGGTTQHTGALAVLRNWRVSANARQ